MPRRLTAYLLLAACLAACTPAAPAPAAVPPTPPPTVLPTMPPPAALPAAVTFEVPTGNPPVLDGTLSPGEWDGARREMMSGGSESLLMHSGGYLYIAMRNTGPNNTLRNSRIIGSLCLDRGGEVAIMHSSRALGTIVYRPSGDAWQPDANVDWGAPETDMGAAAQAQRQEFLDGNGWVASLAVMGAPEDTEYKIVMPAGGLRLAMAFVPLNSPDVAYWPAGLADDCAEIKLVLGDVIPALHFAPESWALLTPSSAPPPPTALPTVLPALDGRGGGVLALPRWDAGSASMR